MIGSERLAPQELPETGRLTEPVGSDGRLIGCDSDGLGTPAVGVLLAFGGAITPPCCEALPVAPVLPLCAWVPPVLWARPGRVVLCGVEPDTEQVESGRGPSTSAFAVVRQPLLIFP